jgi:triphosphoribosyl-dephospho-CoA synthase
MSDGRVSSIDLQRAFIAACEDELKAPKPGNVHYFAPGHGMEAEHFLASAQAAAGPLAAPGLKVGRRIFDAVEATWARVGMNTNLGIVLLCAPLAHAALSEENGRCLRARLRRTLAALDCQDAEWAFRAIMRASPAGLGAAPQHDVVDPPRASLLEAMIAAAHRDRIAHQYATDYEDIFGAGLEALASARALGFDKQLSTLRLYAEFLSAFPDTHIMRKFGAAAAAQVMGEAAEFSTFLKGESSQRQIVDAALIWDRSLKERGLNPGSSADLTVATLFVDYAERILANAGKNG